MSDKYVGDDLINRAFDIRYMDKALFRYGTKNFHISNLLVCGKTLANISKPKIINNARSLERKTSIFEPHPVK